MKSKDSTASDLCEQHDHKKQVTGPFALMSSEGAAATEPAEPAAEAAVEPESQPEAAPEDAPVASVQGSIGIEIGGEKCVTAASCVRRAATAVLVRNEVSNEATPTVVAFKGGECFIGEEALSQEGRNVANTINNVGALLQATEAPPRSSFTMEDGKVSVDYELAGANAPVTFAPELLLALLVKQLGTQNVTQTISDNFGQEVANSGHTLTLAVPSHFTAAQKAAVVDAAAVAGFPGK